jgi:hypothetical protein
MSSWQLYVSMPHHDWQLVDVFSNLAAAADRIRSTEGYPTCGVLLDFHVDPLSSDFEALSHFEHSGTRHRYVIRRVAR